jgi:Holliday junction resolvase
MMPRRVDANHWDVFSALKRLGWCVVSTAELGGGFPDLVAARGGVLKLIEVKDGKKKPSARKLTPSEADFHRLFAAAGCPVVIVESLEDVVKL